ncbi:MAG TPA: TIGR03086 family metal-binding protein [Ilumatobacteraceae bacterium]
MTTQTMHPSAGTATTTTSTAPTSPPTPAADPRPQFGAAMLIAAPVISGVRADQLDLPSPCVELDVKGLLDHLVFVQRRVARLCRGEEAFAPGSLGDGPAERSDWATAWSAGMGDVALSMADDSVLDKTIVLPWATLTGAEMLATYTAEITAHTWDLAQATGQCAEWCDEVCRLALAAMHRDLPMEDRTPMWEAFRATMPADMRFDPPFANATAVAADAPLIDQLVAWLGRKP